MTTILANKEIRPQVSMQLVQGDITSVETGAIVNAAGSRLSHGGGVAAAIARKAGPTLVEESRAWVKEHGPVNHEQPAHTTGGELPCKFVIHAVGPVWGSGNEDQKLKMAVRGALARAAELGLESVSLPAISTGIFGFPMPRAADIILQTTHDYLHDTHDIPVKLVRVFVYDQAAASTFLDSWQAHIA
jgi:O-acetyl-ADP-ribose deacetylase (regulator of RNase III)